MLNKTLAAIGMTLFASVTIAQPAVEYEVTITNITPGQSFTPQLVVTHSGDTILFRLGEPASAELSTQFRNVPFSAIQKCPLCSR